MSGYLAGTIYGADYVGSALPTGGGEQVGQIMVIRGARGDFQRVMLVRNNPSGATLALGAALKWSTTPTNFEVDCVTNIFENAIGYNDIPTRTIPAGYYFFMTLDGFVKPLLAANVAAGDFVAPSDTDGTLDKWTQLTTAKPQQSNIQAQAASGGGGGRTLCWVR